MTLLEGGGGQESGQGHLPYSVTTAPSVAETPVLGAAKIQVWLFLMAAAVASTLEGGHNGITEHLCPSEC